MARHARACGFAVLLLSLVLLGAPAAAAANKEHQQMMADIRMLQEQAQLLQVQLAAVAEALKTISTKMDEQSAASRKAFADQKLLVDAVSGDLRVVREKVDDNNLPHRIGGAGTRGASDAPSRRAPRPALPPADPQAAGDPAALPHAARRPPRSTPACRPSGCTTWRGPTTRAASTRSRSRGSRPTSRPSPSPRRPATPSTTSARPTTCRASTARPWPPTTGSSPTSPTPRCSPTPTTSEARRLYALGQMDRARESWEFVVKTYPNSDAGRLARQRLDQLQRKDGDGEDGESSWQGAD